MLSTEHQEYSIVNQQAAIAEYASQHGFEIVKTYADTAKSGLDIKHRPGLQRLLDDVLAGKAHWREQPPGTAEFAGINFSKINRSRASNVEGLSSTVARDRPLERNRSQRSRSPYNTVQ